MTALSQKPFPLRVQHHPHEPAHGLLIRTAAHNGTSAFSMMLKRFGVAQGWSVTSIDATVIAAKCGADPIAVGFATPVFVGRQVHLLGQVFSKDHWAGWNRRWCPHCLQEAPFHRAWWDVAVITACPKHRVELVSRCECDRPLQHGRQAMDRCQSGHDLAAATAKPVADAELAAERYIVGRFTGTSAPVALLDQVSLDVGISAMEWLGKFRLGLPGTMFDLRRNIGQRRLLNAGFAILMDFPRSFDVLLDDMAAGRVDKPPTRQTWGVGYTYGQLGPWLTMRIRTDPEDILSRRLKDRLDAHARANIVLKAGYVAAGEVVVGTPLQEVADRCGMGFEVFARIAERLGLISVHRERGRPHRVTREHAEAIVVRLNSLLTMERATDLLGVASERVIELVDAGLIHFVDRPYVRGTPSGKRGDPVTRRLRDRPSNKWLFEPNSIPEFLSRLNGLVSPGNTSTYHDLMPLSSSGVLYMSVRRAVELVLDGKLIIRGFDDSAAGLSRLLVSRSEAAGAFKLDRRGGHHALRDAAPLMGLNYNQLRGCVKAGLVMPLGAGKATYLTEELIEHFRQTYIRATEIAEAFGAGGSRVAIRYLREAGLDPVGRKGDLGVTLYRRDQAEPLISRLPAPKVFASTRERAAYQQANGLEVRITRRRDGGE